MLREGEDRFRALSTAGTQVLYRMSADWQYMYQLEGSGVLADTVEPNEDWPDNYIFKEDWPVVQASIKKAVETKSLFQLTHRVRRADGNVGWVLSRAVPILGSEGELREWFGSAVDITWRKEMEDAGKQS